MMVTEAIPVEVSVTGCVDAVFSVTFPNAKLDGVIVSCGPAIVAPNCSAKLLETPAALAVSVTACAVVTDETFAMNPALVAFAGTTSVAGTVTAALLLTRLTLRPPLPDAAVSVTVQLSVPDSVIEVLLQEIAPNAAGPLAPAAAELFTVVPQPNGRRATMKQDNMANRFVERPSSLGIEPRL